MQPGWSHLKEPVACEGMLGGRPEPIGGGNTRDASAPSKLMCRERCSMGVGCVAGLKPSELW